MDLLRETLEAEAELKELRQNPAGQESGIDRLVAKVQGSYQTLIITNPTLCRTKDINAQLWKICFYYDIEAFRRSIKASVQVFDSKRPQDADKKPAAQEQLVRLVAGFKAFLGKTSAFYNSLLLQLEKRMAECKAVSRWSADPAYEDLSFSAHRSLIYLGDTSRYWEMQAESKRRNWQVAERCYLRALRFMPTSGHAHNQLAVTAVYADNDLTALFHYCLSISIQHSFQTGLDNLALFFKKNKKGLDVLLAKEEPASGQVAPSSREAKSVVKSACVKFMRLHGLLFEASRRREESLTPSSAEEHAGTIARNQELDELSLVEFAELLPGVLDRVSHLVVHGQLSEGTLLKMITVSIFSAHRYVFASQAEDLDSSFASEKSCAESERSTAGSYALVLLFSFVNRLSLLADRYRKLVPLILTPLVAFSEWVIENRGVLQQVSPPSALLPAENGRSGGRKLPRRSRKGELTSEPPSSEDRGAWFLPASADTLLLESRARSGMRTSMVSLLNTLDPHCSVTGAAASPAKVPASPAGSLATPLGTSVSAPPAVAEAGQLYMPVLSCLMPSPTRELIELRGFSPMAGRIEGYFSRYFFKDFKDLTALEATKAKHVRLFLLRQFVDKVLSVAPLHATPIPLSMGDIRHREAAAAKPSKAKRPSRDPSESRRYPPGSSSAPPPSRSRSKRADGRPREASPGDHGRAKAGDKRARSSPHKSSLPLPEGSKRPSPEDARGAAHDEDGDEFAGARRRRRSEDVLDEEEEVEESDGEQMSDGDNDSGSGSGSGSVCSETQVDEETHSGGVPAVSAAELAGQEEPDDDDDGDEIIVFKPAFSRYHEEPSAPRDTRPVQPRADPKASLGAVAADDSGFAAEEDAGADVSTAWIGNAAAGRAGNVSSALSWSLFGGENSFKHDNDGERIMESLRLGASSPKIFDDDGDVYGNLLKSSISDPNLWSTFDGALDGGTSGVEHTAPIWKPAGQNQMGWPSDASPHTAPPVSQPSQSVGGSRAPPPGFDDPPSDRNAPPGLTKINGSGWTKEA